MLLLVDLHKIRGLYFLAISVSHAGAALRFVFIWEKQQQQLLKQTSSYAFVSFSPAGLISFLVPDYLPPRGMHMGLPDACLKFSFCWL